MSLKDKINKDNPVIDLAGLSEYDDLIKQHITDTVQAKVQAYTIAEVTDILEGNTPINVLETNPKVTQIILKRDSSGNPTETLTSEDLNVGDVIFILDTEVSDYWVTTINYNAEGKKEVEFNVAQLETRKVDLSVYATKDELDDFSGRLDGVENFQDEAEPAIEYLEQTVNNDLLPLVDKVSSLENKNIVTAAQISTMFSKNK